LLADLTRDEVRTKAMALVGASIGLMFALSLVLAPALAAWGGLPGLFALTAVLALAALAVVLWAVPVEPPRRPRPARGSLRAVLTHVPTLRLNFGVFVLHGVMLAMWVSVPGMRVEAGLAKSRHWWIYLPTVTASFFVMSATLFPLERRGYLRAVFLSAVGLIALAYLGLAYAAAVQASNPGALGLGVLGLLLFVFFCGSNILEASQPSIASRAAPPDARGAALGFYNTLQSLGFFAGGLAGGALLKVGGTVSLFLACAAVTGLWLAVAWPMDATPAATPSSPPTPGT
jgi:predicted MFS family arabinose efflux permease